MKFSGIVIIILSLLFTFTIQNIETWGLSNLSNCLSDLQLYFLIENSNELGDNLKKSVLENYSAFRNSSCDGQNTGNSFNDRNIFAYIEEFKVKSLESSSAIKIYKYSITGDVSCSSHFNSEFPLIPRLLELLPSLAICFEYLEGNNPFPHCYSIKNNQFGHIVWTTTSSLLWIHSWLQLSPDNESIIPDSHSYIILNFDRQSSLPVHNQRKSGRNVSFKFNYNTTFAIQNQSYCENIDDFNAHLNTNTNSQSLFYSEKSTTKSYLKSISLDTFIANNISLQRLSYQICNKEKLEPRNCLDFLSSLTNYYLHQLVRLESSGLPTIQSLPTPANPFVFIHVEKSAGSTLRTFIVDAANKYQLDYVKPCDLQVPCETFSLVELAKKKDLSNVSVVAGHFSWGVWEDLPHYKYNNNVNYSDNIATSSKFTTASNISNRSSRDDNDINNNNNNNNNANNGSISNVTTGPLSPHCFVMGRHPIDRIISYYYERCYVAQECIGYQRSINQLLPEELSQILISVRRVSVRDDKLIVIDDGMSNAACRAIANKKVTSGVVITDSLPTPPPLSEDEEQQALANIESCVVGILENWTDTKVVLNFWFPWLEIIEDRVLRVGSKVSERERREDLNRDSKEIIENYNSCDLKLYYKMVNLFHKQMFVISG